MGEGVFSVGEVKDMTHTELVNRAVKWLKNFIHCRVVLSEHVAYTRSGEIPDCIGWVHNKSILVECKTSLSDFYADRKKLARHVDFPALGAWRFFLTPPGMVPKDKIRYGWGLLEVHGRKIIHTDGWQYNNAGKPPFESDRDSEVAMLLSAFAKRLKT